MIDTANKMIREIRELLGLTQADLGKLLGVTVQTVNRWEKAGMQPAAHIVDLFKAQPSKDIALAVRVRAELDRVDQLVREADREIRSLNFDFKSTLVNVRAFDTTPDHNAESIRQLRHLRETAYGKVIRVQESDGETREYCIAWGGRGIPKLRVLNRNAPVVHTLITARVGDDIDLVTPHGRRNGTVKEIVLLDRHAKERLLGNHNNFLALEQWSDAEQVDPERAHELRQWWLKTRAELIEALEAGRALTPPEEPELDEQIPLSTTSVSQLGDRFFMNPLAEQEEAMRWEAKGFVVVQGIAGSGKTSVALGRAAMLLMEKEDGEAGFTPETCVGFVLSDHLVGYLERLRSGALGLDRMPVKSFTMLRQELLTTRALIEGRVKRAEAQTEPPLLGRRSWIDVVRQALGPRVLDFLESELLGDLPTDLFSLTTNKSTPQKEELGAVWAETTGRLTKVIADYRRRGGLRGLHTHLDSVRAIFADGLEKADHWSSEDLKRDRRSLRNWLRDAILRATDYSKHFLDWLGSETFVLEAAQTLGEEGRHAAEFLVAACAGSRLTESSLDALLLVCDEASEGYTGREGAAPLARLAETPRYAHVFVDEVQDFSEVQVLLMAAQADQRWQAVTFSGDFRQCLNPHGLRSIEDTGLRMVEGRFLGVNKRQSKPLHDLSAAFRREFQGDDQEMGSNPVSARDESPFAFGTGSADALPDELVEELIETRESYPGFTMAVLCPSEDFARQIEGKLHDRLWSENLLSRVTTNAEAARLTEAYRVHFTTPHEAKGLEFDAVYAIGIEQYDLGDRNQTDALYVALTRSRRRLGLSWSGTLAPELEHLLHQHIR